MTKSTLTATEIAQRRQRVAELYLGGRSQRQIAKALKVTQPTVSTDLKALRELWLSLALEDFDAIKGRELARIDKLEREYWSAWRRSRTKATKRVNKQRITTEDNKPKAQPVEASIEEHERDGDPRFLEGVQWCIEQRLKIFGLYDVDQRERDYHAWLRSHGHDAASLVDQFVAFMGSKGPRA